MEHVKPWFATIRCSNGCCPPVQAGPFTSKEQGEEWAEDICDKTDLLLSNITLEQRNAFTDRELFSTIMDAVKEELTQVAVREKLSDIMSSITGTLKPNEPPDTDKLVSIVQAVTVGYICSYRPGCTVEDIKQSMITAHQEDEIGETVGGVQ